MYLPQTKTKIFLSDMIDEINKAMSRCFKNRVKVYPVKVSGGWKIEFSVGDKKPKRYDKIIKQADINEAVTKTYINLSNKL